METEDIRAENVRVGDVVRWWKEYNGDWSSWMTVADVRPEGLYGRPVKPLEMTIVFRGCCQPTIETVRRWSHMQRRVRVGSSV